MSEHPGPHRKQLSQLFMNRANAYIFRYYPVEFASETAASFHVELVPALPANGHDLAHPRLCGYNVEGDILKTDRGLEPRLQPAITGRDRSRCRTSGLEVNVEFNTQRSQASGLSSYLLLELESVSHCRALRFDPWPARSLERPSPTVTPHLG